MTLPLRGPAGTPATSNEGGTRRIDNRFFYSRRISDFWDAKAGVQPDQHHRHRHWTAFCANLNCVLKSSVFVSVGGPALATRDTARLALLWRGDREARREATPDNNRFSRVFEALAALGIHAEPAVYADDLVEEVREQLLTARRRARLGQSDFRRARPRRRSMRCCATSRRSGPWVSAHPDVILKMGVKEVLHRTKHLGWGTDTHLYRAARAFREEFPPRLLSAGPRVLKQNRGNGGQGSGRSNSSRQPAAEDAIVRVLHARRGAACRKTCRSAIS